MKGMGGVLARVVALVMLIMLVMLVMLVMVACMFVCGDVLVFFMWITGLPRLAIQPLSIRSHRQGF